MTEAGLYTLRMAGLDTKWSGCIKKHSSGMKAKSWCESKPRQAESKWDDWEKRPGNSVSISGEIDHPAPLYPSLSAT